MSAQSTPHASTLARLPCAHPRAETHSDLTFSHNAHVCAHLYLPQERIDARVFGKVKRQAARRHGINMYDKIPRGLRGFRGRRGARDASDDSTPAAHRLWAGVARGSLAATTEAQLPLLGLPLRPRLPWLLAGPPSSRQSALGSVSMRPCGRARPVRHSGRSARLGRAGEHKMCDVVARWDHPRVGALGGGQ